MMTSHRLFQLVVSLAVLLGVASAQTQTPAATADQPTEQSKLTSARSKWNSQNPLYYDFFWYEVRDGLVGNFPWRIQVAQGAPARAVDSKHDVVQYPKTVPQMLDELQRALNEPSQRVYAEYDAIYGYPTLYQIQIGTTIGTTIVSYRVEQFQIQANSPAGLYQTNLNLWNAQRVVNYDFQYTDWMDRNRNIAWPLTVEVRNNVVTTTRDNNGNVVNFLIPWSINQYFSAIQRQLNGNSPYIDNTYAASVGYPDLIYMIGHADGQPIIQTLQNYRPR